MDNLFKQIRVTFAGLGEGSQDPTLRERRIPPKKTQSFKKEKKTQNWFWRQMNQESESSDDGEFKTAIAAAAFAVASTEEEQMKNHKRNPRSAVASQGDDSQKEAQVVDRQMPKKIPIVTKSTPTPSNKKLAEPLDGKISGKVPTVTKIPTNLSEKKEKEIRRVNTTTATNPLSPQIASSADKPKTPTAVRQQNESPKENGKQETDADVWEKAQLNEIQKRFERMKSTIQSWESEKKFKARRHLDKTEGGPEKRRARALHEYKTDIARIEKIADAAREVAYKKKVNAELKTRGKAKKYRSTGKLPVTCCCFTLQ